MKEFKATVSDVGRRADVFLAAQFPEFSRSSLNNLFAEAAVWVNGRDAKPSYKLRLNDYIKVDDDLLTKAAPSLELPVLYEDKDVIVIKKPAGILTHAKGALNLEGTVASFIKPKLTDTGLSGNRAGIIHRLDRATSGVIIAAKHEKALKLLQKKFSARQVKKTYLAIVEGRLEPPEAIIDVPLARNPKRPQTYTASPQGKPAETRYKRLQTFTKNGKEYSLLQLQPQTGRTHQLRVHLAYLGHPIVGDGVYGHRGGPLLLHAKSLDLSLPSGERRVFSTKEPAYFEEFFKHD